MILYDRCNCLSDSKGKIALNPHPSISVECGNLNWGHLLELAHLFRVLQLPGKFSSDLHGYSDFVVVFTLTLACAFWGSRSADSRRERNQSRHIPKLLLKAIGVAKADVFRPLLPSLLNMDCGTGCENVSVFLAILSWTLEFVGFCALCSLSGHRLKVNFLILLFAEFFEIYSGCSPRRALESLFVLPCRIPHIILGMARGRLFVIAHGVDVLKNSLEELKVLKNSLEVLNVLQSNL
ncbi:hypothetical protein Tco_0027164 [Tanacetum coccineum]